MSWYLNISRTVAVGMHYLQKHGRKAQAAVGEDPDFEEFLGTVHGISAYYFGDFQNSLFVDRRIVNVMTVMSNPDVDFDVVIGFYPYFSENAPPGVDEYEYEKACFLPASYKYFGGDKLEKILGDEQLVKDFLRRAFCSVKEQGDATTFLQGLDPSNQTQKDMRVRELAIEAYAETFINRRVFICTHTALQLCSSSDLFSRKVVPILEKSPKFAPGFFKFFVANHEWRPEMQPGIEKIIQLSEDHIFGKTFTGKVRAHTTVLETGTQSVDHTTYLEFPEEVTKIQLLDSCKAVAHVRKSLTHNSWDPERYENLVVETSYPDKDLLKNLHVAGANIRFGEQVFVDVEEGSLVEYVTSEKACQKILGHIISPRSCLLHTLERIAGVWDAGTPFEHMNFRTRFNITRIVASYARCGY